MWWIVGLVVVWFLWRLATGRARREHTIKDAIGRAFIANTKLGRDWIDTPIYWEAAERFALDRGVEVKRYYNEPPSFSLDMRVNGEDVFVLMMRDQLNGTTSISVAKKEDVFSKISERLGK
ncbi:hypothetical protein MACH16_18430 [Marinomonas pontica]|uniref:DUF3301 domain-containing protein n=2 Tax=Marinomonas pontica TaxID=264739 RepID=A0ABM8FDX4_9GAMM|nr:hypothetical protein MACH16_18430 [Marinomonas pontica]